MVGLLVLAALVSSGFAIVRLLGLDLRTETRLVVAPVIGLCTGTWALYLIASRSGRLTAGVLIAFLALVTALWAAAFFRPKAAWTVPAPWFLVVVALTGIGVTWLHLFGQLAMDSAGNLVAAEHLWADTPFHASQVTAFAYRDNFPPTYSIALDQPLNYPFLVNFLSGVVLWTGWGLKASLVVVAILVQVVFFASIAVLTHRLTGSGRAAVVAPLLYFFLGNLGFLAVGGDVEAAGGVSAWLRELPWSYTGDALGDPGRERLGTGLYLGNPVYIYLLPERSSALGMAAAGGLFLLLEDLARRPAWATAVAAGLVLGVLPRVSAHAVLIVGAVAATWFVTAPAASAAAGRRPSGLPTWLKGWRRAAPAWLLAGAVAAVIGLGQVLLMRRQSTGFFSLWPLWAGEPHEAWMEAVRATGSERVRAVGRASWESVRFWLLNAGVLLVVLIPAYRRADERLRRFFLPFGLLWVFGNVVKTQPWEWDNNNLFIYGQLAAVIVVAPWLVRLFRGDGDRWWRMARRTATVSLVAVMTAGGLLSYVYWAQHRYHLWTPEEVQLAAWIRDHTPRDAVVLTSNSHSHPVLALSGRQGFMGFPGWISAHNLDWRTYDQRLERMYGGDVVLMRRLGIDYVVLGPWERGLLRDRDVDPPPELADRRIFEPVYADDIGGQTWEVLRLRSEAEVP